MINLRLYKYTRKILCSYSKINLRFLFKNLKKVVPNCFVPTAPMRKRVQFKSPYIILEKDFGCTSYVEEKPSKDEL